MYRWGEDGLLGICDRRCRLCFGVALWNVINREHDTVNPDKLGTKTRIHYRLQVLAGGEVSVRLRLTAAAEVKKEPLGGDFAQLFAQRKQEADEFYADMFRWAEEATIEGAEPLSFSRRPH